LKIAPWPPKFKPVSLPKYNGFGNSWIGREFSRRRWCRTGQILYHCVWRPSSQLVLSATTTLSLQLGWSQDKVHSSIPNISWNNNSIVRSVQL
jgi:hypothetical protein